MKLKPYLIICYVLLCSTLYAQNGWLPPVTFPNNTDLCDDAQWKLVMYDDFNGTSVNHDNWDTYNGDWNNSDNWPGGRNGGDGSDNLWKYVNLDQNVVVSNGTCKLITKHEPVTWHCDTCPLNATRYYTSGTLFTPIRYYSNGADNGFSAGTKFEVKMKMPTFVKAHTTIWTWHGIDWIDSIGLGGANEIDMAEAYGPAKTPHGNINEYWPGSWQDYTPRNTYSTHAWGPDNESQYNPYDLPRNADNANRFPHQTLIDKIMGHYFNQADWHTYTCEWDTAVIRIYLDGQPINNIWKYYKTNTFTMPSNWGNYGGTYTYNVGSECNASGTYKVTYGFPYYNHPLCNFRITPYIEGTYDPVADYTNKSTVLGQAEIEYVAIYQRHPEEDNHTDMCNPSGIITPVINGPTSSSNYHYTFTVTNPVAGATWASSDNLEVVSSSNNSITVHFVGPVSGLCSVHYIYGNSIPHCPGQYASKLFYVQTPFQQISPLAVMCATIPTTNYNQFSFASLDPTADMGRHNSDARYYWTIKYNLGSDTIVRLQTYTTQGKYASMPFVQMPANGQYYLDWTLKIVTPYDSAVFSGTRNSKTPLYRQGSDSSLWYFNAAITDTAAYDTAVYKRVAGTMVGGDADSIDILSMINQVRLEELEPYLIIDTTRLQTMAAKKAIPAATGTRIYPNPANSQLHIEPGQDYVSGAAILINIYDINGHGVQRRSVDYTAGLSSSIDISQLPPGLYFLELIQNRTVERQKIVKQ